MWDLERRECVRTLTGHTEWVNSVAVEPNGHVVVSVSKDKSIKVRIPACDRSDSVQLIPPQVWHLLTGELLRELRGHAASVQCLELLPNGVLSASDDAAVKLWTMLFC